MKDFKQRLIQAALDVGLSIERDASVSDEVVDLRLSPWPRSPHSLQIQTVPSGLRVAGYVRAHGLEGDRTDIHDIIGGLWALHLAATGRTIPAVIDELHEFAVNETYSRHVIAEQESAFEDETLALDERSLAWATAIFQATAASSPVISANFDDPHPETFAEKLPNWLPAVAEITGDDLEHGEWSVGHRLEGAMWQHFRSFANRVTVYRLTPANMENVVSLLHGHQEEIAAVSGLVRASTEESERRESLLKRVALATEVANAVDRAVASGAVEPPMLVWLNSHIVAVGHASVVEVAWTERSDEDDPENEDDDDYEIEVIQPNRE